MQQIIQQQPGQQVVCSPQVAEYYQQFKNNRQFKTTNLDNSEFHLDQRYKIVQKIGQGAYGVVAAGIDQEALTPQLIAVKKIQNPFDQKIFIKNNLRELKLLRLLKHENIIDLKSIILPKSRETFENIYIISELMETDLNQIIKANQNLTAQHIQIFLYQILRGLKYIHSAGVVHRDLKPTNILVDSNCDLKICDFGLARVIPNEKERADKMTDYVVTRWYRPPELLLQEQDYSYAVDVWSVGIIFAELLRRKPFIRGSNSSDQLWKIFELIGTPTQEEIQQISCVEYQEMIQQLPKTRPKDFGKIFPDQPPAAIDLLKQMLTFDYRKRITVEQALSHPYLADLHIPEDEPVREKQIYQMEVEFEYITNLTREQYKDLVYEEILLYHFPQFKQEYEQRVSQNQSITRHIALNDNRNQIAENDFSDIEEE